MQYIVFHPIVSSQVLLLFVLFARDDFKRGYWSWVKYPHLSQLFLCKNWLIRIRISRQIFSSSVICVFSDIVWQCPVCHIWLSALHIFVETSTSGSRRFKQNAPCSLLVSSCFWFRSHNFSFIIQFTSNRLLLHNYHHIILPELVSATNSLHCV